MICAKCGRENPDDVVQCASCGAALMPGPVTRRTSGLAIASLVTSLTCLGSLLGLIFGIVALRQISRRRDELTGYGMAIAGISISCVAMLVFLFAAMLFPVFSRARESARKTQCLANVRNLAIAVSMYATDYDILPGAGVPWSDALEDYTMDPMVYTCPSAPGKRSAFAYWNTLKGARTEQVTAPENQLAFVESTKGWNGYGDLSALPPKPRHLGGENYGYVDGHAKWDARSTVSSGSWPPATTNPKPLEKDAP